MGFEPGLELLLLFEERDSLEPICDLEYQPSLYLIIMGVPGSVISYPARIWEILRKNSLKWGVFTGVNRIVFVMQILTRKH